MSKTTAITTPLKNILRDCSGAIRVHTGIIEERIAALQAEVLPAQLKIGLYCLKAHCAFALQAPGKRNASGKNQHTKRALVHADEATPQGFEGWLAENHPQIKKPTAYRWMTALKGLGLNESATEKDVDRELAKLTKVVPVSLKSLCDSAIESVAPAPPPPPKIEQQEFDFLKQNLSAFRQESENICRLKPQLDAYPDFKRAATARVYSMLYELTGTHWQPSDEPDSLAMVDPDAITI